MTDVTLILSERDAQRAAQLLHRLDKATATTEQDREVIEALRYAIEEGQNSNQLRERLAQVTPK